MKKNETKKTKRIFLPQILFAFLILGASLFLTQPGNTFLENIKAAVNDDGHSNGNTAPGVVSVHYFEYIYWGDETEDPYDDAIVLRHTTNDGSNDHQFVSPDDKAGIYTKGPQVINGNTLSQAITNAQTLGGWNISHEDIINELHARGYWEWESKGTEIWRYGDPDDWSYLTYVNILEIYEELAPAYQPGTSVYPAFTANRVYVTPKITNTINSNGEGVMGVWYADGHAASQYYLPNGSNQSVYFSGGKTYTAYNNASKKIDPGLAFYEYYDNTPASTIKEFFMGDYRQNYSTIKNTNVTPPGEYRPDTFTRVEGAWTTYIDTDRMSPAGTKENIHEPIIENYTLTYNLQGGYSDALGVSWYDSRDSKNLAKNTQAKQSTNVMYTGMVKRQVGVIGDLSSDGQLSPTVNSAAGKTKYQVYTHGNVDCYTDQIYFNYKNYYIVSLPDPQRVGYNFLGWYTAPTGGTKITARDITVSNGTKFTDSYVLTKNQSIYAQWELITKDETITTYWLDNSNSYTTRPEAIYFELYRNGKGAPEICSTYITERINTSAADWIVRFSNETGVTSLQHAAGNYIYKTPNIFDPNVNVTVSGTYKYKSGGDKNKTASLNKYNNIFDSGTYTIKMTGDNANPAKTNTWSTKLENLQKFDTSINPYTSPWVEYNYIAREVACGSEDETTQYITSSNKNTNSYQTQLDSYIPISQNQVEPVTTSTYSKYIVNRISNVQGVSDWKNLGGMIKFEDMNDKYHFRPDELVIEIYQNIPKEKDPSKENYLDEDAGVRVLYKTIYQHEVHVGLAHEVYNLDQLEALKTSTIKQWGYPLQGDTKEGVASTPNVAEQIRTYITVNQDSDTTYFGYLAYQDKINQGNLSTSEIASLKKDLEQWKVPTVQETTGIKYTYDIVITTKDGRYRYTLQDTDKFNNFYDNKDSSGYYYNKHETDMAIPTDNNYSVLVNKTNPADKLTIVENIYDANGNLPALKPGQIYMSQVTNYLKNYEFKELEFGSVYQSILKDDALDIYSIKSSNDKQYNQYKINSSNTSAVATPKKYPGVYESMRYNIRYYEIAEAAYLDYESIWYYNTPRYVPEEKRISYLFYKELQLYSFVATLLETEDVYLPTEFSGSSSASDRTGHINGENDWTFTNQKTWVQNGITQDTTRVGYINAYKSALRESKVNNPSTTTQTFKFDPYENLMMDKSKEYFPIKFTQMEKKWTATNPGGNWTVTESYTGNYSKNGHKTITNINNGKHTSLTVKHESNPANLITGEHLDITGIPFGNEYNILLPLNGDGFKLEYLPDGKYEVTFQDDIDFYDLDLVGINGNSLLTKENGKSYITFSSADASNDTITVKLNAKIDDWRGNVDDTNIIRQYSAPAKISYANERVAKRTQTKKSGWGFNIVTGKDNKVDNSNYYVENYRTK